MTGLMTIGEVADAADTAATTLRYHDDIGLVQVVQSCQRAGFTLEEIGQLLDGAGDWQDLARRKRQELQRHIADLQEAVHLVDEALACGCEHLEGCDRVEHAVAAP